MLFAIPAIFLLLAAAVTDVLTRKIPNVIPAGMVILFFAAAIALPDLNWLGATAIAAAVFLFGAILFATGTIGGGDVKLLAAAALWAGVSGIVPLIVVTALAGGVLAFIQLAPSLFDHARALVFSGVRTATKPRSLPYGVAIAAGGAFTIVSQTILT